MSRRHAARHAGFIITLELMLILTILGIGLFVGIIAVRNALFVHAIKKRTQTVWVYDSSTPVAKVLGPARDFDDHETPRLFFIDRGVVWNGTTRNYRAFVGVRNDRFTSRQRIFYTDDNCGASGLALACIARSGEERADDKGVGAAQLGVIDAAGGPVLTGTAQLSRAGGIGYLYPLQDGPSYGIGREIDGSPFRLANPGLPGTLYRETPVPCDAGSVRSAWTSQAVVPFEACGKLPAGVTTDAMRCPDSSFGAGVGDSCLPPADPACRTTDSGGGVLVCSCPLNWVDSGWACCPPGTAEVAPGQCSLSIANALAVATPVQLGAADAFAALEPPFHVNLPPDANNFELLAPGGFEGAPGVPTGIPYDPNQPLDFSTPADGIEGSPPGL